MWAMTVWAICIWCERFVFDVSDLYLMWAICIWCRAFCIWCEQFVFDVGRFVFDVSNFNLMWVILIWCDSCRPPYKPVGAQHRKYGVTSTTGWSVKISFAYNMFTIHAQELSIRPSLCAFFCPFTHIELELLGMTIIILMTISNLFSHCGK